MNETEREQLAQRLSALSLKDARKEIRRLDRAADMKFYRNSIWDEYHTLFLLPNAGLSITLVEKGEVEQLDLPDTAGPKGRKRQALTYSYVGASVAPLDSRRV